MYTVHFIISDTSRDFETLKEAQNCAENYVQNNRWVKPFRNEETYMYGPGNGSTSIMIRKKFKLSDLD